ncbi:hypothetical protein N5F00_06410 [Pseudomonas chengduensis]|nr:hypothetical protein [Pseudomonas chengduensis]MDH1729108.1 hypothetical protein [Pseudomonas chengduensis]
MITSASKPQAQAASEADHNLINIRDLSLRRSASTDQTNAASQELSVTVDDVLSVVTRQQAPVST